MEIELDDATLVFVVGAIVLMLIYFCVSWRVRFKPDLQHAVIICTAWAGFAPALYLGFQTCVAKAADLGVLSNQRVTILIGVAVVMWVSVSTVYGVFAKLRESAPVTGGLTASRLP
ncbi:MULTISPECIES: hypothetical protein [unclassified Pseudomonas]|uniref:hypothetical protein n=1 Tax=unclassified Pseudomonas TaxID=196821 RepID=UPI0015A258AC|nr:MULTISPECIES: hypothetical protein [unclassified Pseudomonas]NWB20132.1 hypothetical protein [Pseudomonas sp. D4002]NWC02186.1 hypothetical protein [Pseudomonas sp. G1002]